MAKEKEKKSDRHVLIVDDDRDDLAMLVDSFRVLSEGEWHIHAATSAGAALKTIQTGKIQLVILSVNSPVLDIPLLLASFTQHQAQLKKVVMTSPATDEKRAASLAAGADLFIEKPVSPEALKAAFISVNGVVGWALPQGFQTGLRSVGLADLVQMECLARNSSVLELFREHSLGRIYIEEGQIIHAVSGEFFGERAFQKLLSLTGGTFELHEFEPPPERTLNRTWEYLLGEAARQQDLLNSRAHPGGDLGGGAEAVSTEPAGSVMEMLICSGTGEELYNWQCPAAAARLALMQEIAIRAEKIIPEIQLGKLDRMEIKLTGSRIVVQPRTDRLIWVRVADTPVKHEG